MKQPEHLVKILSLIFSAYSPLYIIEAFIVVSMVRRSKYVFLPVFLIIAFALYWYRPWMEDTFSLSLVALMLLRNGWTLLLRRYYLVGSIFAYPLHPWLNKRVARMTGYLAKQSLYELHIDPRLEKQFRGVGAGLRVTRDAKRVSQRLKGHIAVGTTYEGELMQLAAEHSSRWIRQTIRLHHVVSRSQRNLYRGKTWDTFIWEF